MNELLERIVRQTHADLRARKSDPLPEPPDRPRGSLAAALSTPGLSLIAEVKPKSPSKGHLRRLDELEPVITAYRARASAVSVLVDRPFFGGGPDLLARVRESLPQPILAKGFMLDPHQLAEARAWGASAALLIVRLLEGSALAEMLAAARSLELETLVEVHTDAELDRALEVGAQIIGVNARDLDSLDMDLAAARARLDRIPKGVLRVAESGLESREDVDAARPHAEGVLIGHAFMQAEDPAAAMVALGW